MKRKKKIKKRGPLWERLLRAQFYGLGKPASFTSPDPLSRALKRRVTRAQAETWLSKQEPYTLHRAVRWQFPRRRVMVGGIDHQWQADLADVQALKKHNQGYRFLLACIDVLSKYAWVVPLKDKSATTMVSAFRDIFSEGRKPFYLQTDLGKEFVNAQVQRLLKDKGVHFFTTHNQETKAQIVERFLRTFKGRMWKYFTHANTYTYTDVLDQLVNSYNHSYHRSIGMAPAQVTAENSEDVWQKLYYGELRGKIVPPKFALGDLVRISKTRRVFRKGYEGNWSLELFRVIEVKRTQPPTYRINDLNGEVIEGTFYHEELQHVGELSDTYAIDRVLKERHRRGKKPEVLVRWLGYPSSTWIPKSELRDYKK